MRNIYTYFDGTASPVEVFFRQAAPKIQSKLVFQMRLLADERTPFCEPHIKHFSIEKYKRLYEMRLRSAGTMVRVIFYEHAGEVVLLHAFYKRGKKDTERALEYALKVLYAISDGNGVVAESFRKELVL